MVNKNKRNKKRKVILVFDEKKRQEYLTGFSKRKNERKRRAQEELNNQVKEENKRIREEAKETTKKMKKSYQPIPELDELLREKEYDTEDVSVKIVELSTNDLAKQNNWIGANIPVTSKEESGGEDDEVDEESDAAEKETTIPGMDLVTKKKKTKPKPTKKNETVDGGVGDDDVDEEDESLPKSKKELNKIIQKQTLKSMKNSKILQVKRKLDRLKDKKKFRRTLNLKHKFQKDKNKRKPHHGGAAAGGDGEGASSGGRNKKSPRFHNSKDRRKHR